MVAAARHPTDRSHLDGHAPPAIGAEPRWVECAQATGALGLGVSAPGAVGADRGGFVSQIGHAHLDGCGEGTDRHT